MFLGFYTDAQRKQAVFLETTLIGSPGLNRLEREHVFLTANGYLLSESYKQFSSAMQVGNDEFQKAAKEIRSKTPEYLIIDIEAARRAGVSAIPRF